jgi:hypothetical protein
MHPALHEWLLHACFLTQPCPVAGFAARRVGDGPTRERASVYRVGVLSSGPPMADDSEAGAAFLGGMKHAGYVLGQNLTLERRGAMGRLDRLPALAQELIAAKVDVIVTNGFPSAVAAKATGYPTVAAAGAGDPVATGLVESLARPGGTVTGISDVAAELSTKRLALLKELVPGLRQVAMLWNQDDLGMTLRYRASAEAAESLGVRVQALGVREPNDFEAAFAAMTAKRPDAILMVSDSLTTHDKPGAREPAIPLQATRALYEGRRAAGREMGAERHLACQARQQGAPANALPRHDHGREDRTAALWTLADAPTSEP